MKVRFGFESEVLLLPLRASRERLHWYGGYLGGCCPDGVVGNDASQTGRASVQAGAA